MLKLLVPLISVFVLGLGFVALSSRNVCMKAVGAKLISGSLIALAISAK
ncbi:MAG: hypothetical protein GY861_22065 [bacterium]|nr:hypothetical protein [bacterium]